MTEEKAKKTPAAKAAPKAKAAPAAAKKEVAAPKAPVAKKGTPPKQDKTGATLRLVQTGSPIGRQAVQRQTLIGLGLNKLGRESALEDTAAVRGMINKVKHLVDVKQAYWLLES